ncbi:hypothetical protein CHELA17_65153 [Chelatococcus asaccharovorans]|nr:hypothetical protein CHELA17_65153 [Chelatococcus asaccharovorans]
MAALINFTEILQAKNPLFSYIYLLTLLDLNSYTF